MLQQIISQIQLRKPTSSMSTVNQHAKTIYKIFTNLWPKIKNFNSELLVSTPTDILISAFPKDCSQETAKSYAASLGIFTQRPELSAIVTKANESYRAKVNSHKPSDKDISNQLTPNDITHIDKQLYDDYGTGSYPALKKYLCWCLVSGKYIPPRRLLDWVAFKIHHIDYTHDNYIDHDTQEFVFNQYKTAGHYGEQRIRCPDTLYNLLSEYIAKTHTTDFLFANSKGGKLSTSSFNNFVNSLSSSKSGHGVNAYRKAYLQTAFGNILDLDKTMRAMGSSSGVINSYVKAL